MKAWAMLGVLAAVGFVSYQQWNYHRTCGTSVPSMPVPVATPQTVSTEDRPVVIHGRTYSVGELRSLYSRVKDAYVMQGGACLHRWQCPTCPGITYSEFVRQFSGGYTFAELSQPGNGDTVVLVHDGLKRKIKKSMTGNAGSGTSERAVRIK